MITYNGSLTQARNTESATAELRTLLNVLIDEGTVAIDPNGVAEVAELYRMYAETTDHPMTRNMFGRAMTCLGSPTIYKDRKPTLRGGLRIVPAS